MSRSTAFFGMTFVLLAALAGCGEDDSLGDVGSGGPLFSRLPSSATGVTFQNSLEEDPVMNGFTYEYFYNGGGVAVGDLTGNGYPDLYFTGNRVPNRLYLNHGDFRFEEVAVEAGVVGHQGWATGVTFTDVNANGLLDIYVSYSGAYEDPDLRRNQLFVHEGVRDGVPRFVEQAAAYGLDDLGMTTQASFFDADGDGLLDAYVMNHGLAGYHSMEELKAARSPHALDRFYRNVGGRYVDASEEAGIIQNNLGFGLGVSVGDLNEDGVPDVYVANDYSGRDFLYRGRGDGTFDEVLERSMKHVPFAAMGSDLGDFDGDGRLDVVVLEMAMDRHYDRVMSESGIDGERFANVVRQGEHYQYVSNTLQWGRGTGADGVPLYSEIGQMAGIAWTDWSWSALFADLTNSGRPDLFVTNGTPSDMVHRDFQTYRRIRVDEVIEEEGRATHSLMVELLENLPRRKVPNRAFVNEGDLSFRDVSEEWGFGSPTYSHGAVYVDLDRDGDLDLVVNNLMGEADVYRNWTRERTGARFLAVDFEGPPANPLGLGARVRLHAGGRTQVQELHLARGYQSSVEPLMHFGLGSADRVDSLEVRWPDGALETHHGLEVDRRITLAYASAQRPRASPSGPGRRLFADASAALRPIPVHQASIATEDASVRTYPAERDRLALATGDLNGDGADDFAYGGGGDDAPAVYLRGSDGSFQRFTLPPAPAGLSPSAVEAATLDANGDGRSDLWLVHESAGSAPGFHHRLLLNQGSGRFTEAPPGAVPEGLQRAGSVVAPGDFDGDGAPDLFLGEWTAPDAPPGPGSRILRNEGGIFRDVTGEMLPELAELTTVTDALWADLRGGGDLDLVVAGHWMPVRVWRPEGGEWVEVTAALGLEGASGWWESLTTGDFDGDGRMDLVAGNLGLNFPYRPTRGAPFELFVGDFGGGTAAVPAYYEDGRLLPWIHRDELAAFVPDVLDRFPTHHLFAEADLADVLGAEALAGAARLRVTEAASLLLLNGGESGFRSSLLPRAAQISPVMGAVAADFDGSGTTDLVVGGNLYELSPPVPRIDAGVGLLLRGDGRGGLAPADAGESGILVPGRTRHLLSLSPVDAGPPDLLVGIVGEGVRLLSVAREGSALARVDRR